MSNLVDKFLFLATGGTIEFVPNQSQKVKYGESNTTYQEPDFRTDSIIPDYLVGNHPNLSYDFRQICMKDSKDVRVRELAAIKRAISESNNRYVIITHGTDTMVENAQTLEKWLDESDSDKVIVFAGAFRPLEEGLSDGEVNLSYAIQNAHNLKPGVYISANKQIYDCKEVVKDFDRGEFVPLR